MLEPGRNFTASSGNYRYGFNGQEKSTEINSDGNLYNAEYWEYDSRIVRRWNVDPINKEYESPYSVFGNNPIFNIDPLGNDTTRYSVQKGDNLTKISKKFNVPVEYITQLNKLSDPNKLQTGQVIDIVDNNDLKYGSQEFAFSDGVLTKYNNPTNNKYSFSVSATVRELNSEFTLGTIPSFQNTAIVGGPLFNEVKKLSSVQALVAQGLKSLSLDKKFTPGEVFTSTYSIGSITGRTGRGIILQAVKDLFSSKSLSENKMFSAENFLGSFGFSMRVTNNNQIAIAVYDSKTAESLSDHRRSVQKLLPDFTPTYQRYIWYINIKQ